MLAPARAALLRGSPKLSLGRTKLFQGTPREERVKPEAPQGRLHRAERALKSQQTIPELIWSLFFLLLGASGKFSSPGEESLFPRSCPGIRRREVDCRLTSHPASLFKIKSPAGSPKSRDCHLVAGCSQTLERFSKIKSQCSGKNSKNK